MGPKISSCITPSVGFGRRIRVGGIFLAEDSRVSPSGLMLMISAPSSQASSIIRFKREK